LIEFWAVATRSRDDNGLGMAPPRAEAEINSLRKFFWLLPSSSAVIEAWQKIVIDVGITGKQTHDAHLVAMMTVHSITDILTFNSGHFVRFPGIRAINPQHL
jgi:predicted nucleic acid-binding protein